MNCLLIRWLQKFKIHLSSEKRQRSLASNIVGEAIQGENGAFICSKEGGGNEIKEVPFVYVPNLVQKVADLLAHNQR